MTAQLGELSDVDPLVVRPATVADAEAISELIRPFAAQDLMLPKPLAQLYESIRDFQVVYAGDALVGCVALHIFDAELAEIRSLAVAPAGQGRGVGSQLVEAALAEAQRMGLRRVFALVLREGFFGRLGFQVVAKENLPQKVYGECIFCPKFHRCDEVAVLREL